MNNRDETVVSSGGIVLPAPQEEDTREYRPLELRDERGREVAAKAFSSLINAPGISGGLISKDAKVIAKVRRDLVWELAKQLLGNDFSCEEFC